MRGFQGPGILIAADHDNRPAGNANAFTLTRCVALDNLYGVYAVGGDANAGVGLGLDVAGNRLFSLADASSLGSTWIGCHAQGGLGYKTVDFRARGTFVGCYTEGGTSNLFGPAALVVGGTMEEPSANYADAMPSATTVANYTRGDVLLNRNPEELGAPGAKYVVLGWSCVASGHPGTWVDLRALTGN